MNVAIVCWSFSGGGLETRIRSQIEYLKRKGHKVYCIFGSFNEKTTVNPDDIFTGVRFINFKDWSLTVDGIMPGGELAETVDFLRGYFLEHKIDIVEIHADYTLFAPVIAAGMSNIPVTYTVHGPGGIRFFDPTRKSGYLLTYLLLRLGVDRVYCVAEYLQAQCSGFIDKPMILRNGADAIKKSFTPPMNGKWAFISRLDEFKIEPIIKILDIIKQSNVKKLDIYGDGPAKDELKRHILDHKLTETVKLKGWADDTSTLVGSYDCVMGVGRTVVESCAAGIPTVLLSDVFGVAAIMDASNINYYKETNFTSRQSFSEEENLRMINNMCDSIDQHITTGILPDDCVADYIWGLHEEDIHKIVKKNSKESMEQIYLLLRRSAHWLDFWDDDTLYKLLRDNFYHDIDFAVDGINAGILEEIHKRLLVSEQRLELIEKQVPQGVQPGVRSTFKNLITATLQRTGISRK